MVYCLMKSAVRMRNQNSNPRGSRGKNAVRDENKVLYITVIGKKVAAFPSQDKNLECFLGAVNRCIGKTQSKRSLLVW